ncbi:MAG TPA: FAD-dependent oxidoreductase [Gemmatimonadaceae bacterium]
MSQKIELPVVIVGAGVAGLTAARALRRHGVRVRVFEASPRIAGLASSFVDEEGFTYDFGAHFITNRLAKAVGVQNASRLVRYYGESVLLGGQRYSYPFGLLRVPRFLRDGIAARLVPKRNSERDASSAAGWFRAAYGESLANEVALPLVEAWSGAPAHELASSVGDKIPGGILQTVALKALSRVTRRAIAIGYCRELPEGPRTWHVYPDGGVATLCARLASGLEDSVQLESPVERILVENGRALGVRVHGRDIAAAAVISTAPVHVLPKLVSEAAGLQHLSAFRYRAMIFVNVKLEGRNLLPDVVVWTPEENLPYFRLTEAPRSMPWLAPPGKTMITVDFGAQVGDENWRRSDDELLALAVHHLEPVIPDARRRLLGGRVLRTPIAYPVFLKIYEKERLELQRSTGIAGLYSVGRNGEFDHILMEDVYVRTERRVLQVLRDIGR